MEPTDHPLTYAPVASYATIRLVLALSAAEDLQLYQADIKSAYLIADLPADRDVYMEVPPGLPTHDEYGNGLVCKLHKSIYGLADSGRLFNAKLVTFLESNGFRRTHGDTALYVKGSGASLMMITSWVDDLLIACRRKSQVKELMDALNTAGIEASSHSELHYLLGMEIGHNTKEKTITVKQRAYITGLLETYRMADAKPALTPMVPNTTLSKTDDAKAEQRNTDVSQYAKLVGSLLYLANTTRCDIAASVGQLARFMSAPAAHHMNAAVHVLKYLKGTVDLGLTYNGKVSQRNVLHGFTDSDWGGCRDTRRSTTGYAFILNGASISWSSRRQATVATSTAHAEIISASEAAQEAVHLRMVLEELGFPQRTTVLHEDNMPCIKIAENPVNSGKCKHISIRDLYVREKVTLGEIALKHCRTEDMAADALTKNLDSTKVLKHRATLMGTS
jgi:deoxycytidylate deaminase